uniref:ribosomal protein S2 n=1 Tax=Cryptomonas gyropyrenoidosa TaxID=233257 RepID=UPI0027A84098
VEKRRFRMGINNKRIKFKFSLSPKDFISTHIIWGHKKSKFNNILSPFIIGLKQKFALFNPEHLVEQSKRSILFCSNVILKQGCILFIDSFLDSKLKDFIVFFGSKSLQPIFSGKWLHGFLTKHFYKTFDCFIIGNLNNNTFLLKETVNNLVPVIAFQDSNNYLNKNVYPLIGNDDSKKSAHFFYNFLSNAILKSLLYRHIIAFITSKSTKPTKFKKNVNKRTLPKPYR